MVNYYEILGITSASSLADAKKAYRQKAKLIHPDVNDSPTAHEDFILLNEAYEYIQNVKTGKIFNPLKQGYTTQQNPYRTTEEWEQNEREKARERARQYAQMEYEQFIKTDYYKNTVALSNIMDFIYIGTTILIFSGPILGFILKGLSGMALGLFVIFITVHFWSNVLIHNRPKLNFKNLISSAVRILRTTTLKIVVFFSLNLFLIFRIGFNTLIPIGVLIIIYIVSILLGYLITLMTKSKLLRTIAAFGIAPGVVNLFFLANFLFSNNIKCETYSFTNKTIYRYNYSSKSNTIELENNKYSEYLGIRVFMDFDEIKHARQVTYYFADGLFGIRVLKRYEFK